LEGQPDDVDWPEIVVFQAFPEQLWCDWFPIVHGSFAWIITNNSIYNDCLLSALILLDVMGQKKGK
jgi:hypothetical protein